MKIDTLKNIISSDENEQTETIETLVAFANTNGELNDLLR